MSKKAYHKAGNVRKSKEGGLFLWTWWTKVDHVDPVDTLQPPSTRSTIIHKKPLPPSKEGCFPSESLLTINHIFIKNTPH
jgi:hypothetical protein